MKQQASKRSFLGASVLVAGLFACGGGGGDEMIAGVDAGTDPDPVVDCSQCQNGTCDESTGVCSCEPGYVGTGCAELGPPSTSLVMWLDAEDPVGDGQAPAVGPLAAWVDKAGSLTFTSEGDSRPALATENGAYYVEFDGADDFMSALDFDGLTDKESYTVVLLAAAADSPQDILVGVKATDGGHGLMVETADEGALRFLHRTPFGVSGGDDFKTKPGAFQGPTYAVIEHGSDEIRVSLPVFDEDPVKTANAEPFDSNLDLVLGKLSLVSDDRFLDGGILEILIYDAHLSDEDRQHLDAYVAAKWAALLY